MAHILVAYNEQNKSLHFFFEACADKAKQFCIDYKHTYTSIPSSKLTNSEIINKMSDHQLCFIATHGDEDGVYNDHNDDVVSIRTRNYVFTNKGFYAVACSCAKNLKDTLVLKGLKLFVGYYENLRVPGDNESLADCVMEGLRCLLSGDDLKTCRDNMLRKFDEAIEVAQSTLVKSILNYNKERLVVYGTDETITLNDLL